MTTPERATIAALASGRPPAAIAVLRISGPRAFDVLTVLTGRTLPPLRRMTVRRLIDPVSGEPLDDALVVRFAGSASATGEDCVELHLHGGAAVTADVLGAVTAFPGARLAEPGEFTRRAFDNGRIGLDQVEGLADLIAAETAEQRRQALALAGGALGRAAEGFAQRLLVILADVEAALDFGEDEADVAERLAIGHEAAIAALAADVAEMLEQAGRGSRIRDGLVIALTGAPNVGKSSLMNALTRRNVSIVMPVPGTTRDRIEATMDLDGIAVTLIDTAGLRETDEPAEREGVARARAAAAAADLVVHVLDGGRWQGKGLIVVNKIDLGIDVTAGAMGVSALTGEGVDALRAHLAGWARSILRPGEPALIGHARHKEAFQQVLAALRQAQDVATDPVLLAECLRAGRSALARISGHSGVEDVLGAIFARFCIGK